MTFEFVLQGVSVTDNNVHIPFTGMETEGAMAGLIANAINSVSSTTGFGVTASIFTSTSPAGVTSDRVSLFGATGVPHEGDLSYIVFGADGYFFDELNGMYNIPGDADTPEVAGETIVNACKITNSLDWGIVLEPGTRPAGSNDPEPGCISPLTVPNVQDTVGGVTIVNNVVANSGNGGIDVLGDSDPIGEPTAAVPFYRIVNNTIYAPRQRRGTPPRFKPWSATPRTTFSRWT